MLFNASANPRKTPELGAAVGRAVSLIGPQQMARAGMGTSRRISGFAMPAAGEIQRQVTSSLSPLPSIAGPRISRPDFTTVSRDELWGP